MDEVTQQNAALVEEAAAASHSMQEQAAELAQVVGFFKTGNAVTTQKAKTERRTPAPAPFIAAAPIRKAVAVAPARTSDSEWEEF
jgi:methyl-accepting chemotaxis protein